MLLAYNTRPSHTSHMQTGNDLVPTSEHKEDHVLSPKKQVVQITAPKESKNDHEVPEKLIKKAEMSIATSTNSSPVISPAENSIALTQLIEIIATILDDLIQANAPKSVLKTPETASTDGDQSNQILKTKFHCRSAPSITMKDYLKRIAKYARCSLECYVLALIYIDQVQQNNTEFLIETMNIHRYNLLD
jgi:hypothetical protein